MDEDTLVNRINEVCAEEDYPVEMSDISDVENFLNDERNMNLEIYEVVEQLYSEMMEDIDYDTEDYWDTHHTLQ